MAEATKEPAVLTFVTTNYEKLKSEAQSDNNPVNGDVTVVIQLIDNLYHTIIESDATYDKIVGQLKPLQTAYDGLKLTPPEYVSYNEANNRLKRIIDVTGVEEEKEEETEEEEEEEGEEEEGEEEEE